MGLTGIADGGKRNWGQISQQGEESFGTGSGIKTHPGVIFLNDEDNKK
jgi:hypothetical protein